MSMTPKLHSIESIAVETGRDRRTIAKVLREVPPDGELKGRPAWYMKTALQRLNRRLGGGGTTAVAADSDELLQLATTIDRGFKHARGIADLEERREFLRELGPSVGRLDQKLSALNPDEEIVGTIVQERIVGDMISEFLALANWQLRPEPEQPGA
jgi:hypothetical protein